MLGSISIHGFYDIGAAWKQDAPLRESAATAGFGVSTENGRVSGSLEFAAPLTHADVEGRKGVAAFAEIAVRL
jgi:hemolysin activation/secretion protein